MSLYLSHSQAKPSPIAWAQVVSSGHPFLHWLPSDSALPWLRANPAVPVTKQRMLFAVNKPQLYQDVLTFRCGTMIQCVSSKFEASF